MRTSIYAIVNSSVERGKQAAGFIPAGMKPAARFLASRTYGSCSLSARHVIVWDLDGTLGRFDALNGQGDSANPVTVRVRPHLREALEALSAAGFRHTLLTLATPLYAELVLHALGVRALFERVEGQGQRGKGDVAGI